MITPTTSALSRPVADPTPGRLSAAVARSTLRRSSVTWAGPSGSAIFPDRPRVVRPAALPRAIRATPRLPDGRRAAGWSGGRCVDGTLSRPALRSRVLFPEHYPAASSLPQGNCRPVDPRGSRPANFSPSDNGRQTSLPAPPEPAVTRLRDTPRGRSGTARKAPSTLCGPCRPAGVGTIVRRPTQSERRQFKAWQPGETGNSSREPVLSSLGPVAAMRQARLASRPVEQRCSGPAFFWEAA